MGFALSFDTFWSRVTAETGPGGTLSISHILMLLGGLSICSLASESCTRVMRGNDPPMLLAYPAKVG